MKKIRNISLILTCMITFNSNIYAAPTLTHLIKQNKERFTSLPPHVSGLPADMEHAEIDVTHCTSEACTSLGTYHKKNASVETNTPFALTSQDQGQSWAFSDRIFSVPLFDEMGFFDLTCASGACIATGTSVKHRPDGTDNYTPLLLVSKNNGYSWSYSNAGLSLWSKFGLLYHVVYSNQVWMIGGYYEHPNPFPYFGQYQTPLFLVSQNNGISWNEVGINGKVVNPPPAGIVENIKCYGTTCFAVGSTNENRIAPLITRSIDSGLSWSLTTNISGLLSDDAETYALDCAGSTCVANISYILNGTKTSPPLLISHDEGLSWTTAKSIQGMPDDLLYCEASEITCSDSSHCAAKGQWFNKPDSDGLPMTLTTQDSGTTWVFN